MATISDFLIERMVNAGLKHAFGVPGDYILNFYKKLYESSIDLVGNSDECHSGFAANAYARVNGIGAICVTYNVGALKIANAVACAYSERTPLLVICGSPGIKERTEGVPLHHMVKDFDCQRRIFDNITCSSIVLDNPSCAGYDIDKSFAMMQHQKRPVYIELPRDMVDKPMSYDVYKQGTPIQPKSDEANLEEALLEVTSWIEKSENPVILAGVQVSRFNLGNQLLKFAEKVNIPIVTTLLGKSVISEKHPLFAGVYFTKKDVKDFVDKSDCLLVIGEIFNDISLNGKTMKQPMVSCSIEGLSVKKHHYDNVNFQDFCKYLFKADISPKKFPKIGYNANEENRFFVNEKTKIKNSRFFDKINSILMEENIILSDIGDSIFGASDLVCHHKDTFIGSSFYASMGTAVPGALGVQLAKPNLRPIVLVGDGAFQMSVSELSTIVNRGLNPIIFILNNHGYTTERCLSDGGFNDIRNWNYHKVVEVIGGGIGFHVNTEEELESAIGQAIKSRELSVINVDIDSGDISSSLKRVAATHAKRI